MRADRSRREIDAIRDLLRSSDLPADVLTAEVMPEDERLLDRIRARTSPADLAGVATARAWRRSAIRFALAAVAVVAVVAVGVVYQGSGQPVSAGTPPMLHFADAEIAAVIAGEGTPASDALRDLAATASSQPDVRAGDSQQVTSYSWYEKSDDTVSVLVPSHESMLVRPNGSAVHTQVETEPLDGNGHVVDGQTPAGGTGGTDEFPAGTLDPQQAVNLPREPQALRQALIATEQGVGCDGLQRAAAECLVRAVKDLAAFYVLPPDLEAAIWTVLAGEPDVVRLGATTDRLGRSGVAVAVQAGQDEPHGALVLVISSDDGRLLEWDDIAASAPELGVGSPVVTAFQALQSAAWIPSSQ